MAEPLETNGVTRRDFVTQTLQASLAVSLAPRLAAGGLAQAGDRLDSLRQTLAAPPDAAKPMTRWWWFGGAVTPEEITRELTFMRDAGLRGAEIQPVYPVTVDDPAKGIRHLSYQSAEFVAALRHASREGRRLGLQIDLTLGSGWPYGGPFIGPDLAARRLRTLSQDVAGPRRFSWQLGPLMVGEDRMAAVVIAPVRDDGSPALDQAIAVPRPPNPPPGEPRPGWLDRLDVPAGRWRVMVFIDSPTGMLVKRPTLGMEGLVLDHHDRTAMTTFLEAAGSRVFDAVGAADGPPFHSVFCDSLEVYGADWTTHFVREFEKRRGYDVTPYLPALFTEAGPLTRHVRYDYHLTLSDLIIECFFEPLAAWSERRGVQARIQAHGAMGDVVRGYGLAHVPEGENIFLGDKHQVNLKHRRLAASAAHLYGKRLVSAETFTWLRTPLYTTTLEMMKAAVDACLLDGVNHIVNHGYSYSPPQAGEPGWAFYASTEINHTQTWWRHYPHLARYIQRASALLREGASVNPVLVYLPMADIYAEYGAGSLHLDVEVASRFEPALFDALRRAGYDFDVVNDHALAEHAFTPGGPATGLAIDGGTLRGAFGAYKAVIVSNTTLMPAASARKIVEFAKSGGHVIVIGALPSEAPGLKTSAATDAMRAAWMSLWGKAPHPNQAGGERGPALSERHSAALVADVPAALDRLGAVLAPDCRIVYAEPGTDAALQVAREHVGFTHRQIEGVDLYFVANVSGEARRLRAQFSVGHRAPERWDLEGGAERRELAYEHAYEERGRRVTEVELSLAPFESCAIVFGPSTTPPVLRAIDGRGDWTIRRERGRLEIDGLAPAEGAYAFQPVTGAARRVSVRGVPAPQTLDGPWTLALGSAPPARLDRLRDWTTVPGGERFSGWGVYDLEFRLSDAGRDVEWVVDLGAVHETAEVSLNGKPLGAAWKGLRRLRCGDALVAGANRLRVEVANLWITALHSRPGAPGQRFDMGPGDRLRGVGVDPDVAKTYGIRWGTYGETPPTEYRPSGLLGPVRLVAMKRVRATL